MHNIQVRLNLFNNLSASFTFTLGDFCRLPRHYPGFCNHISRCPFAIRALRRGITPITCSFDRHEPIVCCPDLRMIVTPPHLIPQDKNPVILNDQTTTPGISDVIPSTTTEEVTMSSIEPGTTSKQSCNSLLIFPFV